MPNPNVTPIVAGIDVGKKHLDAHVLPLDQHRRFANDKCGRRALRNWLCRLGVTRVVFEATGRLHRPLHQCLSDAGLETVLANPTRSRRFAEAIGHLAKNDRVDALMLASYALLDNHRAVPPKPEKLRALSDLLVIRRKLVEQRAALRKVSGELGCDAARQAGAPVIAAIDCQVRDLDRQIQQCLADDEGLARRAAIVQSIPGCGPGTAASLCADMPELGALDRRQAAALIGLAPFAADSGGSSGRRRIHGGRQHPRNVLFMAATAAIRCNASCQALYDRLTTVKAKKHKVALVAVMRQLVVLANALLRDDRLWQPQPPAREVLA